MNLKIKKNFYDFNYPEGLNKNRLILNVIKTIEEFNMINSGDSVLISVSGGPDSVFLTYFFNFIKNRYKLKLYAFHLDHLTRDGASTKDADFVKELSSILNIKLFSIKIDAQKWCLERRLNFQEGARILRKNLLEKYSRENSINKIALAHTADDNLETFFMNLLRGAGLKGLGAIRPVSGNIIRPLICCFKKDITCFLDSYKISYCVDKTNLESKYLRNKIRNKLIPALENQFGESFKNNILNTINALREDGDYIEIEVTKVIKGILSKQNEDIKNIYDNGFVKVPAVSVENLNKSLKTAVIFKLIELVKGDSRDINYSNINDIVNFCYTGGENRKINLSGKISFIKEGSFICIYDCSRINTADLFKDNYITLKQEISKKPVLIIDEDRAASILKTNKYKMHALKTSVEKFQTNEDAGIIININDASLTLKINVFNCEEINKEIISDSGSNEAYMDLDKLKLPVFIRSRKNGDRFFPLGTGNVKKLQDFFTDLKVPFHLRNLIPVFFDTEKIIWIGGCRIDDRIKVDSNTKTIFYLKIT